MSPYPRPPRPLALAALAVVLGAALAALALRSPAPPALATERTALLGAVGGAPPAAPPGAPQAQVFGTWAAMGQDPRQAAEATSAPSAVSWGPGRLDVFVRGRSGELYQNYREGAWSGWRVPEAFRGVALRSAPSCASWGAGRLSCAALVDGSDEVWHFYWDGAGWARESLGGFATSAPSVVSPGAGQLAVFVAGRQGQLFGRSWVRGQWSEWRDLGGALRSAPACAAWPGDQLIQCFVTSTQLWVMRQEVRIGQGSVQGLGYVHVSMRTQNGSDLSLGSAPAAVAVGPRRVALLALSGAQTLFTTTWAGSDQVLWQSSSDAFSPMLNSAPGCAVAGGRLECFARGPDSRMLNGFGDLLTSVASVP